MLHLESVDQTFHLGTVDEKVLFSDFSFHVSVGEFVTVIGSNGSGKTTLLNIIAGDLKPNQGKIILDGKDYSGVPGYRRAKDIGRVFQDPSMGTCPNMTIWENLSIADHKGRRFGLAPGLNRKRKEFYQSQLELLGMGLEDRLHTKAGALSGGQRQALALIMATLVQPKLLLLDEHTAALDPKSADIVMALTQKVVDEKKITTMMITHNLRYAVEYGSRTVMMHDGKIVMDHCEEERTKTGIDGYLKMFNEISIECGN